MLVGGRAGHRLVLEAADAGELRFLQPVEQDLEVGLGLAGEADDEGGADGEVGADVAPAGAGAASVFSWCAGRRMALSTAGEACWKGMSR